MLWKNINKNVLRILRSWDSSISVVIGYGLDGWDLIPGRRKIFFSTPQHSDRLCGPYSLLYNGYWGYFPKGKAAKA
jgi:hypothetical protein